MKKINRNALLAGIISTVLFIYFLEPILGFLGRLLILFFRSMSQTLYDRMFQEIALGKPEYSYAVLQILNIVFLSFLLTVIISSVMRNNEHCMQNKEMMWSIGNRKANIIIELILYITIIILGVSLVISDIKLKTIQAFEQQIKIITPYIDQHTKELIISDFSKMRTSTDFEKVRNTISSIVQKNDIILPETRNHLF